MAVLIVFLNDCEDGAESKMNKRFVSLRFAAAVAAVLLASNPGVSAETAAPASAASPASSQAPQAAPPPRIDPRAEQLLSRSRDDLASRKSFTFHAEITSDQAL